MPAAVVVSADAVTVAVGNDVAVTFAVAVADAVTVAVGNDVAVAVQQNYHHQPQAQA